MGQSISAERKAMYVADLADTPPEVIALMFTRARQESQFFPSIAELRALGGTLRSDVLAVESNKAWQDVEEYLKKHGVAGNPYQRIISDRRGQCTVCNNTRWVVDPAGKGMKRCTCVETETVTAPVLGQRVRYAIAAVGGLELIAATRKEDGTPTKDYRFTQRDFIDAYNRFDVARQVMPQALPPARDAKQLASGDK